MMVGESVATLFISLKEMGSVKSSLIFKELVSTLVPFNYERNQCFLKFLSLLCHSYLGFISNFCGNSSLNSLLKGYCNVLLTV
jgi:hypothetical protein